MDDSQSLENGDFHSISAGRISRDCEYWNLKVVWIIVRLQGGEWGERKSWEGRRAGYEEAGVVVVVLLPSSLLLGQARGPEIADRSLRSDPEIHHIYDVVFLSKCSQDHAVFHDVFYCVCGAAWQRLRVLVVSSNLCSAWKSCEWCP